MTRVSKDTVELSRLAGRAMNTPPFQHLPPEERIAFVRAVEAATTEDDLGRKWRRLLGQARPYIARMI